MKPLVSLIAIILVFQSFVFASPPAPDISNASINAAASYEDSKKLFTYTYTAHRGMGNEGNIVGIDLDIKTDLNIHQTTTPLPNHPEANKLLLDIVRNAGVKVIPVEQKIYPGWARMGLSVDGYTGWSAGTPTQLRPGETAGGFVLTSPYPPGIRQMRLVPAIHEYGLYADADASDEEKKVMYDFVDGLNKFIDTLGPIAVNLGSLAHWDQLKNDLNKSIKLGWIPDTTFASVLVGQLATAREALDAGDVPLTNSRLQTLISQMTNSVNRQRRMEVRDLVLLNCKSLIRK